MVNVPPLPEIDDPQAVTNLGEIIKSAGNIAKDTTEDVRGAWAPISSAYHAPEEGIVHGAMNKPAETAQEIQSNAEDKCTALHDYADKLSDFRSRKTKLEADIASAESDLALAEALPDEVSESDPNNPDETRMVHNDAKDAAIAAAESKLELLAAEVQKLIDDLEAADEELAAKFWDSTDDHLLGDLFFNLIFSPTANLSFIEGVAAWCADLVVTARDLFTLGSRGVEYAWNNRGKFFDSVRGLPDFFKGGGLGRTKDSLAARFDDFFTKENAKKLGTQALTWTRRQASNIAHDPAHALGYIAPEAALAYFTGGTSAAASVGTRTTAGTVVRTGAKQFTQEATESVTGAAGRELLEEGAERGAHAAGSIGRNQVSDSASGITETVITQPGAGKHIVDPVPDIQPNTDAIVPNQASIPGGPTGDPNTWVSDGTGALTDPAPKSAHPVTSPEPTILERLDQYWTEAEKPTQRIMTDLEYTNTRRRADLAARYEALGDPSTAAAVRYLYNADTVRNLHSAVLEDPTFLRDFKLGIDDISFSPNNSIAPNVESRFTEVVDHYATDAPLGPQQGPVPPPEWKVDRPTGHVPTPDAIVIDSISTRTRHAHVQWEHYADADLNRSFHVEDGKVLGNKNDSGNFSDVFKDGDYRKDGKAARASIDEVVGNARDSVGDTKFDAGHSLPGPLAPNIGPENFTPQNPNLNRGSLNQFEKFVQSFVESPQGGHVRYESAAHLDEFGIPTDYDVHVLAKANATGETIVDFAKSFENTAGRQFSLNPETLGATDQPDLRPSNIDELFDAATGGKDN